MSNRCAGRTIATAALLAAVSCACGAAVREIDVRSFAQAPGFALAALSPDGAAISYVEHPADRQTVVLRTLHDAVERRTLEVQPKRERIRWCDWASSTQVLCGTISPVHAPDRITEQTHLYVIDRLSGGVRELNSRLEDPVRDQVIDFSAGASGRVLLQHDPAGRGYPEVAELDIASGVLRRVVRSHPPVRRWMSDGRGTVRLGIGYGDGKGSLHVRRGKGGDWSMLFEQSLADVDAVGPLALGVANELYVLKHHQGRAALFRLDLDSDRLAASLLFADPLYDVAGPIALDPQTGALLSVQYVDEHEQLHFFDDAEAQRVAWLDARLPDAVNVIVDRSADGRHLLVRSTSDANPPSLYLFDSLKFTLALIGHQYPQLENRALAPMRPFIYRARDGQRIPAYLTMTERAMTERAMAANDAARGLPAVVLPHGGPETRNLKTFDPLVQFLAAQGYAVLQMNFRGSLGYGAGFAAAGVGQWGGIIHNDITDGTRWLVEQGIADPTRVCIAGVSFGGYAALLGAARESEWYACVASFAGVADLMAFSQYTARLQDHDLWRERLGADQRALWQMSPMARIHAIETPVLLMHGRSDPVVPVSQARRFARALRNAGKEHRFIERSDCDHDMSVDSCRMAFFVELGKFLAAKIGDSEPGGRSHGERSQ